MQIIIFTILKDEVGIQGSELRGSWPEERVCNCCQQGFPVKLLKKIKYLPNFTKGQVEADTFDSNLIPQLFLEPT